MKKYIIGGVIASVVIIVVLFAVNYFTCFGYYLPHKATTIYMAPEDMSAHVYPTFVTVPSGFNQTTVR